MKKVLLLFIILIGGKSLTADEFEKNYGRGVVHLQLDSMHTIEFFSTPEATTPSHHISILRNAWNIGTHYVSFDSIHFADTVPHWFTALYYIPTGEYARIDIIATDSSNGFYRTILKDDQGREVWIRKSKHVSFLSWFGFYRTVASIQLIGGDCILYDKPDAKSNQLNYNKMYPDEGRIQMRPLEVQGNWMKVEIQIPQHDPLLQWKTYNGWIQWRDEKQPLVKYNLMGC